MTTDPRKSTGFFSSARLFAPEVGRLVSPGEARGYYIDFGFKAQAPEWPPDWLRPGTEIVHVATTQWALGCYERYLGGEGEGWLRGAQAAADHLLAEQDEAGNWVHGFAMPHTFPLDPPWISAMAQGQGASLLVRIASETGDDRYAAGAAAALRSFARAPAEGGVRAELDGGPFFEEYPTDPPSFVLNGGIFALWGAYDAAVALGSEAARRDFDDGLDTLASSLHRWDTGTWSLYDLYPLPLPNVASSAYHLLHVRQLEAMTLLSDRPEISATLGRWRSYREHRRNRTEAFARKAAFRVVVPRNRLLGRRLPWTHG